MNGSSAPMTITPVSSLDWPGITERVCVERIGLAYWVHSALRSTDDALSLLVCQEKSHDIKIKTSDITSSTLPTSSSSSNLQSFECETAIDLTSCSPVQLNQLNYYEILGNIPIYSSADVIRKAYYKACLKYHPDKEQDSSTTSNNSSTDQDPVFLKVKEAFDTLSVPAKRKAYDSTCIAFDDSIPSLSDLQSDADFYSLFGSCFDRNLRFAQEYDPDPASTSFKSKSTTAITHLGNDETPIEQVYAFYSYWTQFDSWRDFSLVASQQLEHDLDMAQDRYEKRFMEKEIKKVASKLKKNEMLRIQKLVERARGCDPRILRDKERKLQEKIEKELQLKQQEKEEEEARKIQEQHRVALEEKLEQEKIQLKRDKDQAKLQLRMARQYLRKVMVRGYELEHETHEGTRTWSDLSALNEDIEILTSQLHATSLNELSLAMAPSTFVDPSLLCPTTELIDDSIRHMKTMSKSSLSHALSHAKQRASHIRTQKDDQIKLHQLEQKGRTVVLETASNVSTSTKISWTKEEISALAKAVKKYPPGSGNRWDSIATFVNNLCKASRSREECIEKFNQIANQTKNATSKVEIVGGTKIIPPMSSEMQTKEKEEGQGRDSSAQSIDWTEEQDQQLQTGLSKYPSSMDKNERWTLIAKGVKGKSKKECVERFKTIREAIMRNKE